MHQMNCSCARCGRPGVAPFRTEPFRYEAGGLFESEAESETGYPISEAEEEALALELLAVSSEEELDQFLGKLLKGAWKGIKKVGSVVGKVAGPLGGVLKAVAKKALPFVGGALGSFIPIPGVGTAVGSALGGAVAKALELETGGMDTEEGELEMARRFVRIATTAAQQLAASPADMDETVVNEAVVAAARQHLPQLQLGGLGRRGPTEAIHGRWVRRGRHILVLGA
jgi:hypothetical protein